MFLGRCEISGPLSIEGENLVCMDSLSRVIASMSPSNVDLMWRYGGSKKIWCKMG